MIANALDALQHLTAAAAAVTTPESDAQTVTVAARILRGKPAPADRDPYLRLQTRAHYEELARQAQAASR